MDTEHQTDSRERHVVLELKRERIRQGLSATKLAQRIGVSRSGVCHIEGNRCRPTLAMLLRMADGLGVLLKDYLDFTHGKRQNASHGTQANQTHQNAQEA